MLNRIELYNHCSLRQAAIQPNWPYLKHLRSQNDRSAWLRWEMREFECTGTFRLVYFHCDRIHRIDMIHWMIARAD